MKGCGKEFKFRLVYGIHKMKCGKKYQSKIRYCEECSQKCNKSSEVKK